MKDDVRRSTTERESVSGAEDSKRTSGEELRVTIDLGRWELSDAAKRRVEKVLTAALEAELRSQPIPQYYRKFYIVIE